MPFLFDDEPSSDAEEIARRFVDYEQRLDEQIARANAAIRELREYMVAIALARKEGIDPTALETAAHDYLGGLEPETWWQMAWGMAWDGGIPAEREAAWRHAEMRGAANPQQTQEAALNAWTETSERPGRHRA